MADNNLQASFRKLMRYAQNLAEYEQGIAEGIIDENVFVIVLDEKVAKFKGHTFDWSESVEVDLSSLATKDELVEVEEVAAAAFNDLKGIIDNIPSVEVDAELSADSENAIQNKTVTNELNTKVDKVEGKQLSTEDFTTPLKEKLEGLNNTDTSSLATKGELEDLAEEIASNERVWAEALNDLNERINEIGTGGGGGGGTSDIVVDAALSTTSTNAIQNKAVANALNEKADASALASKQDTLVSGTNIKTVQGQSILGSGNISISVPTVDAALSSTSTNAVQNKVVKAAIDELQQEDIQIETQLAELSKKTGVSLIANKEGTKPNIYQESGIWYLDFGDDTILLVGSSQYVLVQLHSDTSKFRKIPLNHESGTSAVKVVFNLDSATFYTKFYAENLTDNEVLIGGIRYSYTGKRLFNFPFEYTINGQEQWDADIEKIKTETSEVIGANLRRNFVLISSVGQPKPNIVNSLYLDMGEDPVVCVNNKYYILNALDSEATYRNISLLDIDGSLTSAVILVFNTESAKLYCRSYDSVLAENEIEVGGIRRGGVLVANLPFEYTINGKELWEIGASDEPSKPEDNPQSVDELRKHINVSLIADIMGTKPNLFQEGGIWYLDFGTDPILLVGNTQYVLVRLHSDTSKFRKIPLNHESGTSAVKVVFNLDSATFYTKLYDENLTDNEVLIGGIRYSYTGKSLFNFPFEYTIRGKEQWETSQGSNTGDVRQLRCKTAMTFMAHRGLHLNGIPENSLDAYRYAARCGFDYAETDFQVTSDGELVLMHNESINATMRNAADYSAITGTINVSEHTLADLRENYVLASSDVRMRKPIPTLEEYFITCRNSGIFPVPEIKAFGMSNEQIKKAHDLGCAIMGEGNFGFCSFSAEYLDYARTLSEKTILCYIMSGGIVGTNNSITGNSRVSPTTWWYPTWDSENYGDYGVTLENVRRHKEAGVKVAVWTTPVSQFDNLLKKEIDCISTDDICPSIDGLVGKVATSDQGFSDFDTTGYESDGRLILSAGQTCRFNAGSMWLGGYYLSIIGKGNFTISAPNLNVTISNSKTDRYIYQGLVNNQIGELTIMANDNTELEFVEFSCVEL